MEYQNQNTHCGTQIFVQAVVTKLQFQKRALIMSFEAYIVINCNILC